MQKFNLVAAQLDSSTAALASDILKTVPEEDGTPYTKLKGRILEALSLSTNEKADKLIAMNGFGDKIPSQGLQAMLKLVPEGKSGESWVPLQTVVSAAADGRCQEQLGTDRTHCKHG